MFKGCKLLFSAKPFHHTTAQLVTVPIDLVYSTVLDVPSYSRFLPWCKRSQWIGEQNLCESSPLCGNRMASLAVDFKIFKESYTSNVSFEHCRYIKAVAADSDLFDTLDTVWEFKSQGDNTLIDFYITFKFHRELYQAISSSLGHMLTATMLEHFVKECHRCHRRQRLTQ
ncbi:hypothetical protein X943_003580 [Babesia divergens]|uniref:Coenzyme Q-binding protein COQ10 START domain-containing protein n=1 Tax=Babesia divergens TaxID=32595 RepID=A0AAD9GEX4_BABDI|nr:hypothetical protein X943_003580 [Babesia divergens]